MKVFLLALILLFFYLNTSGSSILLHAQNATVWLPQQTISGTLKNFNAKSITVHVNDSNFIVPVYLHEFSFSIVLTKKSNLIWVEAEDSNKTIYSDTLKFTLGFKPSPVVKPYATQKKNIITLQAKTIYNPYRHRLFYYWQDDKHNPATVHIENSHDSISTVILPLRKGIYNFNLLVTDGHDSAFYKTYVIRTDTIHCFNIETDHASWIDSAVIYEITPHVFVKNGKYDDITKKLPELKKLGINTIWLQPVFKTHADGQGYDVTDYFSLRDDLGNEEQLQQLITTAKSLNIKVIFDFVLNHTSIYHPYAVDCMKYGKESHYYNFYQHTNDGAKYSSLYRFDSIGFVHYFWKDLVNLDYQNPEVERWMIEACKYWLKKFDIDGYRFDAVWAVNARNPHFAKQLQLELKSIKPDILFLAEDKGADFGVYEKGFDAAYDWEIDTTWISHWSWQYEYSLKNDLTIFNYPDAAKRDDLLQKALFRNGDSLHLKLRFIENNDLPRFVRIHGLERTKMAAALEFSLPGIPLIYNGQEIGAKVHPYSSSPVFLSDKSISSFDKDSLFEFYQYLIDLRTQHKSLCSTNIKNIKVDPSDPAVAFHRWTNNEHFIVTINMRDSSQLIKIFLDHTELPLKRNTNYILRDMLTEEIFPIQSESVVIKMKSYSTRILMLTEVK